jgi:hypothetical protein
MPLAASYLILIFGLAIGIGCLKLALALSRTNKIESDKSAARVPSIWDAIRGRARTQDDWMPDARVKGGLIYNRRTNKIELTGRLSDSTLERVFKRT